MVCEVAEKQRNKKNDKERRHTTAQRCDNCTGDAAHTVAAENGNIDGKKTRGGRFATIGSADAVFVLSDDAVKKLLAPIIVR